MKDDELTHYGVIGMKWGRRKSQSYSGGSNSKKKTGKKRDSLKSRVDKALDSPERRKALKKYYKGKDNGDHAITALASVAVAQIGGSLLVRTGNTAAGAALATMGTAYALGTLAGNMYNQAEYDRRYKK